MSAPYYQDGLVTLYHGDAREVTQWLAADVLVTDPPYGVRHVSKGRVHHVAGRFGQPSERLAGDESTVLRDEAIAAWGTGPALVFGTWRAPRPAGTRVRLIWDKQLCPTGNLRLPWGQSDEEIYLLGEWPPIIPGGWARRGGKPSRGSSVLQVRGYSSRAKDRPNHPTPKPVDLMYQLIERCPPGAIADPFAGSGATLLAAHQLGRPAIGVEIDERYCEIVARRLMSITVDETTRQASGSERAPG